VIRGWLARKRFQHTTRDLLVLHQQASIIQAQWRLFQTLSVYELQRFAIVFLQSAMRGWLVRRRIAKSCASVMVQSAFRGWRVRRQLVSASRQECASSATLIQSHWKRYQAQSLYELQSFAIVLLQSVFRVFLVQKRLEKRYASALIQSLVRGWLARRQLEQTFAASFLQSMARGWLIRKRLNAQQEEERSIAERRRLHDISIILIQSQWRRFQAQSMYEIQLLAVVVIQSVVRVFLVQKGLEKTFAAALLQSVVRGWLVRMRLEKTFASALIQSVVRGWLARKKFFALRQQATAFVEHKEAAIVLIQASWRRSKAHFLYNSRLRAIVVIQSVVRVFVVLKQLERTFAAALLQSVTRGWLERRQLEKRIAAAFNARRRENSALVIQRQWRMYRAQTMYELQTYAIVFLQSVIRGFQARRAIQTHQLALLVRSVRVMQRWIRSHLNRCKERQSSAATLIQARWRGSIEKEAYKFYQLMLRSVIVVQVAWREYRIKKARNGRTPSASPNRDNIRRQFLFNSSYSLESVVPSSPSSVTVFTSGEYSAVYASSEISAAQRHDTHSTVVAHCDRREPARITLDMSNPKSRLAPILTCFGSDRGLPKNLSTSQDLVEAAATIQEAWRTCIARLSYQRKLTSIKMIQSFIRSAKSFRPNQRVSLIDRKELTPKSSAHDDFKRPFEAFQESCRSPSKAVIQLRRCSLLQSTKAPVLTWF
jgi:abnormal spindle-like microcephaly-associated protein